MLADGPVRKPMFNEGLIVALDRSRSRKKRAAGSGSQEFNREASNRVAPPLGQNPDDWMPTVNARKA
jgi:hypothetical protein